MAVDSRAWFDNLENLDSMAHDLCSGANTLFRTMGTVQEMIGNVVVLNCEVDCMLVPDVCVKTLHLDGIRVIIFAFDNV